MSVFFLKTSYVFLLQMPVERVRVTEGQFKFVSLKLYFWVTVKEKEGFLVYNSLPSFPVTQRNRIIILTYLLHGAESFLRS